MAKSGDPQSMTRRRKTKVVLNRNRLAALMADKGVMNERELAQLVMRKTRSGADKERRIKDVLDGEHPGRGVVNEIARALGASPSELIDRQKTAELDSEVDAHNARIDALERHATRTHFAKQMFRSLPARWLGAGFLCLAAAVGLSFWFGQEATQPNEVEAARGAATTVDQSATIVRPSLAFFQAAGPRSQEVAAAMTRALASYWPVPSMLQWLPTEQELPAHFDKGLRIVTTADSGFLIVSVTVTEGNGGDQSSVWTDALPENASDRLIQHHGARGAEAINERLTEVASSRVRSRRDIQEYIRGLKEFSNGRTELMFRRAQTIFQKLVDLHPTWANARAGLCGAYLEEHRQLKVSSTLEIAEPHCHRALQLDPDSPVVLRANGLLKRRQKDPATAELYLRKSLETDSENAGALVNLGQLLAVRFVNQGSNNALIEAIELADRAIELDPENWKSEYFRARLAYIAGDIDTAVSRGEAALAAERNNQTYGNLSAFLLCRGSTGDFERARTLLTEYKALRPDTFNVLVNLGVAHFYLRDFEAAAKELGSALEIQASSGGIDHRPWGNYADALRNLGQLERAVESYEQALGMANAAIVRGENSTTHKFAAAYYQSALLSLNQAALAATHHREMDTLVKTLESLEDAPSSPGTRLQLAKAWALIGETDRARESIALADVSCPGYLKGLGLNRL